MFGAAGITDFLDGRIARSRGLITNFGILMDPLADKIMTCSAFIAFVESTRLNPEAPVKVAAWMVIIIVARELAITGLRLLAASKNIVLAAEKFGKHKTVSQIVAINALLVVAAYHEWPPALQDVFTPWVVGFAKFMLWVTVTLTAASGLIYPLAQPRALSERHVKLQNREGRTLRVPNFIPKNQGSWSPSLQKISQRCDARGKS